MDSNDLQVNLSREEYKYVLEALLFACSVDVSADWYDEDVEKLKTLCFRFRSENPDIITENTKVVVNDDEVFALNDARTDQILEYFPEIVEKIS